MGDEHRSSDPEVQEQRPGLDDVPISRGVLVAVKAAHGEGIVGNARLARIEDGRVLCLHVATADVARCMFSKETGSWVETELGAFALVGQAITRAGEPGGEYIVAVQVGKDGTVPCVDPTVDDAAGTPYGTRLPGSGVVETMLAATNATGLPLVNFATLDVCTSSNPHPDGAQLVGSPAPGVFCYRGAGAGLNDHNGWERDHFGNYLPGARYHHVVWHSGVEVPGAKRPATRTFPYPGFVNTRSPIVWRLVYPYLPIANP